MIEQALCNLSCSVLEFGSTRATFGAETLCGVPCLISCSFPGERINKSVIEVDNASGLLLSNVRSAMGLALALRIPQNGGIFGTTVDKRPLYHAVISQKKCELIGRFSKW